MPSLACELSAESVVRPSPAASPSATIGHEPWCGFTLYFGATDSGKPLQNAPAYLFGLRDAGHQHRPPDGGRRPRLARRTPDLGHLRRHRLLLSASDALLHRGGRQVSGRIARTARNIEIAAHQPRLSARPWKCRSAALPQQNPNWPRPAVNGRRDGPPYCPPTPRAVQLESARRQLLARSQHAADRLLTARVLAARDGAGAHFRPFSGADGLGGHHHRDWDPRFGLGGPGHPSRCVVARFLGVLASLPASPPRARLGRHR